MNEPIARLLHWHGPKHYDIPYGGVCARTFAEFSKESADRPDSYWKNGEPLFSHPKKPDAATLKDAQYALDNPDVLHTPEAYRAIIRGLMPK